MKENSLEDYEKETTRRGFLKKSVIVTTPIILSAWGRPVLAQEPGSSGVSGIGSDAIAATTYGDDGGLTKETKSSGNKGSNIIFNSD